MSLVTVSAIVNSDTSFVFPPLGLPDKRTISVHQVGGVTGMYQIIYDTVFQSAPVVTISPAWLNQFGTSGGDTRDNAVINEITASYATVKTGNNGGGGEWRPFTIVLTGHLSTAKKPKRDED